MLLVCLYLRCFVKGSEHAARTVWRGTKTGLLRPMFWFRSDPLTCSGFAAELVTKTV